MRKIIAGLYMSLDGVVESPEKWHFPYVNEEMDAVVQDGMAASDTLLLGRHTYEIFAGYWPSQGGGDNPLADQLNGIDKVVVSTTLSSVEWQNSSLISGNVTAEIAALKERPGKDIHMTGSVTLVRSLLREGLLDELSLLVHPIVVGGGRRLFEDGADRQPLELVDSKTFSTGVVHLTYGPAVR